MRESVWVGRRIGRGLRQDFCLSPQRKEASWPLWLLVMAVKFNLLHHFDLIGHLGRWLKHTDKGSGLVKINIGAKEGDTNPHPFWRKAGEMRHYRPLCRSKPGCQQDWYLPTGTQQHRLPLAQGSCCENNRKDTEDANQEDIRFHCSHRKTSVSCSVFH